MSTYKDLKGKAKTLYDSLEHYITHNREAVDLLNLFKSYSEEVIKEALNTQNNNLTLLELARSIQPKNEYLKEKKSAIIQIIEQKMREVGLKVPAEHNEPPVGSGGPASREPILGTSPSSSDGQDQSHGGGSMTEQLTPKQQELYDSLEGAIKNGTGVDEILSTQVMVDLSSVFNINKGQKLYDLLDYTTDQGRAVAGAIFEKLQQVKVGGSFTSHLRDKIYDAAMTDNNAVAEGILQFARTHSIFHGRFFGKLRSELESAVLNDSKENANKIFNLAKNNSEKKDFLLVLNRVLYESIEDNKNDDLVKILNFASTHNVLEDLLNHRYTEGTALEFARKQNNEEAAKVIKERMDSPGIKVDQYKHSSAQANNNGKTTTFLDKLSEHKWKIAVGTVGTLLLIGSGIAFALGQLVIGVIVAVAVTAAVGILAKKVHAEYKGQDVNDKSVPKAIESVLSDMLPGSIKPHKAPQPGVVD